MWSISDTIGRVWGSMAMDKICNISVTPPKHPCVPCGHPQHPPPPGYHLSVFYHCRGDLPVLEFHVNRITQWSFFPLGLFYPALRFSSQFTLLHCSWLVPLYFRVASRYMTVPQFVHSFFYWFVSSLRPSWTFTHTSFCGHGCFFFSFE